MKTIEVVTTKNVEPQALAHLVGQEVRVTYHPDGASFLVEVEGIVSFADQNVLDLRDGLTIPCFDIETVEVL